MPTIINPIITNAGFAAAQAQSGLGLQLAITHVQIGSGGYTLNTAEGSADYNRTGLVTPKETVAIAAGHVTGKGFRVDALFAAWVAATYGANEIGFWAGNPASGGTLFAYWAQPSAFVQRNNLEYLASFGVGLSRVPNGSVTITFDPDLQKAIALMTYHEQAADPHPQYLKRAGDSLDTTPPQFDNDTSLAPTAFVQRALGNFRSFAAIANGATLTVNEIGKVLQPAEGAIVNIPSPSVLGVPDGACVTFIMGARSAATLQCTGTARISIASGDVTSLALIGYEVITLMAAGSATTWVVANRTVVGQNFASSNSNHGFQRLPSGVLLQWGQTALANGAIQTVTFPIAFPNLPWSVVGSTGAGNASSLVFQPSGLTKTTFNWSINTSANAFASGLQGNWIAVGT